MLMSVLYKLSLRPKLVTDGFCIQFRLLYSTQEEWTGIPFKQKTLTDKRDKTSVKLCPDYDRVSERDDADEDDYDYHYLWCKISDMCLFSLQS